VAGLESLFQLRAASGSRATLQLMEDAPFVTDPDTLEVTQAAFKTAFSLENRAGSLTAAGTRGYPIMRLQAGPHTRSRSFVSSTSLFARKVQVREYTCTLAASSCLASRSFHGSST
jgi:hypothetical protein